MSPALEVTDLYVSFPTPDGEVQAVRGLSLHVDRGEVLGVVGESGSGKSVSMLAVMGLLPKRTVVDGSARCGGTELIGLPERDARRYRGSRIAMVFQDPMTSLNPVMTVGAQIAEAHRAHHPVSRRVARQRALELLDVVGIPNPRERASQYPHEFSGGMRQRVMIAMAMVNDPEVLIADEPTTALDVTIQAQVLETLDEVRHRSGTAIVLITHDLGVIARMADRVLVVYAGRTAATGDVESVFARPAHPYTAGLLASLPRLDSEGIERLSPIPGVPPSLVRPPSGCAFHPRCAWTVDRCRLEAPLLVEVDARQRSACYRVEDVLAAGEQP